jgi:hypothetical protein
MLRPYRWLIAFLPQLWSNWITLLGTVIASISGVTIVAALAIDLTSSGLNTYAAAILFLVIPGLFGLGLVLIPLGLAVDRRRPRGPAPETDSVLAGFGRAMESDIVRRRVALVVLMTVLNVFIFSAVTYRAATFMDTPKFCGNACHSVMQPEYDAYKTSPHGHVACVACHIGDGAESLVKAKLNGLHQVWGVVTGRFHRPIDTPVHNLRPAGETCGNCHRSDRDSGTRLAFRIHFKPDESNTPQVTAMMFHLGGEDTRTGAWSGIHFHASTRYQIRYELLDAKRERIGKIQKLDGGKVVKEWLPPNESTGPVVGTRTMDCTDCHNRATHVYDGTPEQALTRALADGRLDRKVRWLYQEGLGALKAAEAARREARRRRERPRGAVPAQRLSGHEPHLERISERDRPRRPRSGSDKGPVLPLPRGRPPHGRRRGALVEVRILPRGRREGRAAGGSPRRAPAAFAPLSFPQSNQKE